LGGSTFACACGCRARESVQAIRSSASFVVRYLGQDDIPSRAVPSSNPTTNDDDETQVRVDVPGRCVHRPASSRERSGAGMRGKNATERKLARREAFAAAERLAVRTAAVPDRAKILIDLYERGDLAGSRRADPTSFANAPPQVGACGRRRRRSSSAPRSATTPRCFGVLAYRFDAPGPDHRGRHGDEDLPECAARGATCACSGAPSPEVYTQFVIEVLRHYPELGRVVPAVDRGGAHLGATRTWRWAADHVELRPRRAIR